MDSETETQLKKIEALQKMFGFNDHKLKETVSELENAKKEIKTVKAEKLELVLKLKNCQTAKEEDKKYFEALLEKSREDVTKLEKKNEATEKQLKFQGKIF